ncbi:MAG: NAD(P)H-dependent oxidoreductase [Rubrobacter sp.]|nr:NAD(P)H-dependent oxidoreductase [Rubrobacter sp.]
MSLRCASIHQGLLRAAREVCRQGTACESFDLGLIPYLKIDVEAEGDPEPVCELKEKVRAYDAVLIATSPEYDYAIPGVISTALGWCLRSPSPLITQAGWHRGREPFGSRHSPGADGPETDPFAWPGLRDART